MTVRTNLIITPLPRRSMHLVDRINSKMQKLGTPFRFSFLNLSAVTAVIRIHILLDARKPEPRDGHPLSCRPSEIALRFDRGFWSSPRRNVVGFYTNSLWEESSSILSSTNKYISLASRHKALYLCYSIQLFLFII